MRVELQKELYAIQGDTEELSQRLQGRIDELQKRKQKLNHLAGDLTNIRGQFAASKKGRRSRTSCRASWSRRIRL
jgi:hypothetical protein